jgi:hypothetical protein
MTPGIGLVGRLVNRGHATLNEFNSVGTPAAIGPPCPKQALLRLFNIPYALPYLISGIRCKLLHKSRSFVE